MILENFHSKNFLKVVLVPHDLRGVCGSGSGGGRAGQKVEEGREQVASWCRMLPMPDPALLRHVTQEEMLPPVTSH